MVVSSKFNPWDTGAKKFVEDMLLVVKFIMFDLVGESLFGFMLEKSDRTELSSSRRLSDGFSDAEEVLEVALLMLVSLKCYKREY